MFPAALRSFPRDPRANVGTIFALTATPLIFAVGMALDYSAAAALRTRLNAAADAAALAAVSPALMTQSDAASIAVAKNMFNAQVAGLPRLIYSPTDVTVTVSDVGLARYVTVAYTAQSRNSFGGILNMNTIALGGTSTGGAATPLNIDFYLLLDSSPSMGIAGTPADIARMVSATPAQGGCAFACHDAQPAQENPPNQNPGGEDNYALARSLGVTLRADLLDSAITNLTNTAYNAQTSLPVQPAYRMSINSFDMAFHQLVPLTSNYVSDWSTQLSAMKANNTQFLEVYTSTQYCSPTTSHGVTNPCGAGVYNDDADTNYDAAMSGVTALMPTPGTGSSRPGDTPAEVLFIVTDGVEDETVAGNRQLSTFVGTRDWCTPLKDKGIKIAILYTEYFPLSTDNWYNTNVAPFQPEIGTTLQNCASPGLYYEVGMGQDLSTAFSELFQAAVASAHLSQ